ncbi:hypothetical protein MF672_036350 [Actinomadura sp. ATCC 31491]|uniref:Uncharacterized protein n=1 Tax=Actinomadura luzonensis TaxID=2805427 RepID=A0ABT0G3P2_9ACTN|nr:hypothetical protein [Actinomadura luzonensis]MCK2219227.1 hypothetical protein [Actinomadura luzonensis]
MLDVLGTIGSLLVVLLLLAGAIALIAVLALVVLAALAGTMVDWRRTWRRLTGRDRRLTVKLSGERVPERLRGELTRATPRLRRRFPLTHTPTRRHHTLEPH